MSLANRVKLFIEFKQNFDSYLRQYDGNQLRASQAVFLNQQWDITVSRELPDQACYLIYGNHYFFVDSCASNLVVPTGSRCKRIVNSGIARRIGEQYLAHNFGATSRFRWRRFWQECENWYTRFYYMCSTSWFGSQRFETQEVVHWLRDGNSLIIFPTGVFGRAKWKQGIGRFVMDYLLNTGEYRLPLHLVSLKSNFCFANRRLAIDVLDCFPANEINRMRAIDAPGDRLDRWITEILSRRYSEKLITATVRKNQNLIAETGSPHRENRGRLAD